ncbi:MAG: hypothetical protein AAFV33_24175 [Chloroflexota bacterium]
MPDPILTFGFIIATLFGASFHLLFGGGARRLALFLVAGWAGFASGHIIGILFAVNLFRIGSIRFFSAAVCTITFLFFAHLLTRPGTSPSR